MLFARALSILARELFSDLLTGCYTEGEISSEQESETSNDILMETLTPLCEWVDPNAFSQKDSQQITQNSEENEETNDTQS